MKWAGTTLAAMLALGALTPGSAAAKPGDVLVTDYDAFGDDRGGIFRIDPVDRRADRGRTRAIRSASSEGIVFAGGQILVSDEASRPERPVMARSTGSTPPTGSKTPGRRRDRRSAERARTGSL